MKKQQYEYDVAFSFAGEDRAYADKVAKILKACKINIFYDDFENNKLWGEDLYKLLAEVYSKKSKFVVIFISEHYVKKKWTKHELKYICDGIFNEKIKLLPVKLDNTEISEIPTTTGYLEKIEPEKLAYLILKKINKNIDIELMLQQLKQFLNHLDYAIYTKGDIIVFDCPLEDFYAEFPLSFLMELYYQNLIYECFVGPAIVPN